MNPDTKREWHANTHVAMVAILCALWNDMSERRKAGLEPEADAVLARFMDSLQVIGQGITAFSLSSLQTHSLISNTVQLW